MLTPIVLIAYAIAVAATLLLLRHVALRYPSVPPRIPMRIGIDGRPSKRTAPKAILWLAPGLLFVIVVVVGIAGYFDPPPADQLVPFALVFVVLAEVALFVGWTLDRQIEVARKMTYRVAPMRTLRAFLPILATIVILFVLAVRS